MSSFWGALAFADVELPAPLTWGAIKGLQLRNLRYWAKQPGAYYLDVTMTIGYCYPNHNMTENYSSPGSPYWFCKAFAVLAIEIETWVVPPQPNTPLWPLRVHRIKSDRKLWSAEGGFAIYGQGKDGRALEPSTSEDFGTLDKGSEARAAWRAGVTAIAELGNGGSGLRYGKAMRTNANTTHGSTCGSAHVDGRTWADR